jgi:serine/threonine protein kinase
MWSLGVLLYEMCTLEFPFDADSMPALRTAILQKDFLPIPDTYSSNLNEMITGLLRKNPKNRLRMSHLLKTPLIKKVGISVYGETQFDSMVVATTLPSPLLLNNDKSWMEVIRGIKSTPFYKSYLIATTSPHVYKQPTKPKWSSSQVRALSKGQYSPNPKKPQVRQFSLGLDKGMLRSDNSIMHPVWVRSSSKTKNSNGYPHVDDDSGRPTSKVKRLEAEISFLPDSHNQGFLFKSAIRNIPEKEPDDNNYHGAGNYEDTSNSTGVLMKRFEVNNARASGLGNLGFEDTRVSRRMRVEGSSVARLWDAPPTGLLEKGKLGMRVPYRESKQTGEVQELPFLRDYTIETFYRSKDPGGKLPDFSSGQVLRRLEEVQEHDSHSNL